MIARTITTFKKVVIDLLEKEGWVSLLCMSQLNRDSEFAYCMTRSYRHSTDVSRPNSMSSTWRDLSIGK